MKRSTKAMRTKRWREKNGYLVNSRNLHTDVRRYFWEDFVEKNLCGPKSFRDSSALLCVEQAKWTP